MDSFVETDTGILMVANGFDAVQRWDGQTSQMEPAGLTAPLTAPILSGSGAGSIVGTYNVYVRYVDRLGFYSNLSPISGDYTASGTTGTITDASFAAPIVITSAAHGLSTGNIVKVSGVGGNTSANATWTITRIDANSFSLNGSTGNATYIGAGTWISGVSSVAFTSVPVTGDAKVARRQLLRNTDGQQTTYYVDVDTTDLSSTSFSSTKTDATLLVQESQAILDSSGLPLANLRGVPPSHKAALAAHLGRMFATAQFDENRGSIKVTSGSTTVTGVGTNWVSTLAGRKLYVVGAGNNYDISSVNVLSQTLTLSVAYLDTSDEFALYAIRPQPAERKLLYYTPAGQPESWPPTYALQIPEDEDEPTGLMSRGSFLYILERRHIYKLTFQSDPAQDGAIFMAASRGCINNRCWIVVDNDAYMMDEFGLHKFGGGGGEPEKISGTIQEMFRAGGFYPFKINWRASRWFHCALFRPQETIRWFVALEGEYLPRHSIAYNYRLGRAWLERLPFIVGAACSGHIGGIPYGFVAGESAKVYAMWQGTTDVADPTVGTIRGTVTSAGLVTLTDLAAVFATSGLGSVINAPVTIVDKTGKGQTRKVVAATATQLTVDQPWTMSLDTTSIYQVGGVNWNWKSTWLRMAPSDTMTDRTIEIMFQPTNKPTFADFNYAFDFGSQEIPKGRLTYNQGGGVRSEPGIPGRSFDLEKPSDVVTVRIPGHREKFIDGRRYLQLSLSGSTNEDQVAVYEVIIEGAGNVAIVTQAP